MKRVLIIGCCGSIGTAIAAHLSSAQIVCMAHPSDSKSLSHETVIDQFKESMEFKAYQCYDDSFLGGDYYPSFDDWIDNNFKTVYPTKVELGFALNNRRCPRDCLIRGIRGGDLIRGN